MLAPAPHKRAPGAASAPVLGAHQRVGGGVFSSSSPSSARILQRKGRVVDVGSIVGFVDVRAEGGETVASWSLRSVLPAGEALGLFVADLDDLSPAGVELEPVNGGTTATSAVVEFARKNGVIA